MIDPCDDRKSGKFERLRLELRPLAPGLGAEVRNLDLSSPLKQDDFAAIYKAWLDFSVLLFRDQVIDDAELVAFSRRFGPLDYAPPNENGRRFVENYPEILVISNVVEAGVAIGSLGAGEAVWHSDMGYLAAPPTGSLLYAVEVPDTGGETSFLNMYMALEALSRDLQEQTKGLYLKHDASTNSAGYLRQGAKEVEDIMTSPGAVHPLVRRHPETGRDALFLGRRRHAYLPGLSVEDSEDLLDSLWAEACRPEFVYRHHWRAGDLLIWDNRCTMHRRDAFSPQDRRIMHRTQVKGDRPVASR